MKIRQALERAKLMRLEPGSRPARTVSSAPAPAEEPEWTPPVYSASRRLTLDIERLIANGCACAAAAAPELDHYKLLRTRIQQHCKGAGGKAIMVTSPRGGRAKTRTAVNLALTFAKAFNQTVMLVDCDLRQQAVHQIMGFENPVGLADYFIDRRPFQELIVWPNIPQMTVVSGGRTVQNSAELIGSVRMKALVEELKGRYRDRILIFDAAPVLEGADALSLSDLADGIILVVEEGRTGMREVKDALAILTPGKILGYVLHRQAP